MSANGSWRLWLGFVAFLTFARGVLLAGLIPPFNGPDEPAHFDYVQRLGEDLRLPIPKSVCGGYSAENRALTTRVATLEDDRGQVPAPKGADLPLGWAMVLTGGLVGSGLFGGLSFGLRRR